MKEEIVFDSEGFLCGVRCTQMDISKRRLCLILNQ